MAFSYLFFKSAKDRMGETAPANAVQVGGQVFRSVQTGAALPRPARQNTNRRGGALSRHLGEALIAVAGEALTETSIAQVDGESFIATTLNYPGAASLRVLWSPSARAFPHAAPLGEPPKGLRRALGVVALIRAMHVHQDPDVIGAMREWVAAYQSEGPRAVVKHFDAFGFAADTLYGYLRWGGAPWYSHDGNGMDVEPAQDRWARLERAVAFAARGMIRPIIAEAAEDVRYLAPSAVLSDVVRARRMRQSRLAAMDLTEAAALLAAL